MKIDPVPKMTSAIEFSIKYVLNKKITINNFKWKNA